MKTTITKPLPRRTVLRGACGAALSLPLLEAMLPRRASAAGEPPRRVMFVFLPNGNEHNARFTTKGETTFALGEFLQPLEPYRNEMLLLDGIDKMHAAVPSQELADGHQQGGAGLAPWKSGSGSFPIGGTSRSVGYVEGPSADFVIGSRVIEKNPSVAHRHLVYRVGDRHNNIWNVHAHGGPAGKQTPINPETDPYTAYARIFASVNFDETGKPDPLIVKRIAKQRWALDLIMPEARSLRAKLGPIDRPRLDEHLQSLSDIERTLKDPTAPTVGGGCRPVTLGNRIDPYDAKNHAVVRDLFAKIAATAFACDLTRVVNFAWAGNTSGRVYANVGSSEGHHDISHKSDAASFAIIRKINRHLWGLNVKIHDLLKSIPEAGGTVWDNTLIVHWNELGQGDLHSVYNDLVVLSGGASKHFKMGRLLQYAKGKASFSDVLVNVFHYMGFTDVTRFGDPRMNHGAPLPGLTA